ncbi:F0F1 ATP synthase subunit B [Marinicauda salina]|uniref:ATP synthase subunit b n=1 Tax=Marinicauda salina TaxID=2135793 RepID=A0A2U2BUG7_9PROT|nr:F0F1 ATP synthase subunit B [Marinicauda salina]PWE17642.1 F0F1 ATP synthase subunit B [Marinicauda salina]
MGYLFSDPTFWAFIGLIVFFVVIALVGAPKMLTKMLDDRAENIRKELDEARRLREEAQERLATYERRQREAAAEAEQIVKQAKHEADLLREDAKKQIAERIERRTAMAEQRIAQAEAQAAKEVRAMAADLAVEAASALLQNKLTKTQKNALVKDDIAGLKSRLN